MEQVVEDVGPSDQVDISYARMIDAFHTASKNILSEKYFDKKRPWTSRRTLDLITERNAARKYGDFTLEKQLGK